VSDHTGKRIPRTLHDLGLSEPDLSRHIAWDIGIAGVARRLASGSMPISSCRFIRGW